MAFFDLILLLILFGFVWFGFWNGLFHALGGLVSVVVGVFIASRWYEVLALKFLPFLGDNFNISKILAFIAVFIVARFIVFLIFRTVNKFFELPILKIFNKLGGAAFGLIEGALIIGLLLYFSTKFPLGSGWLEMLENSNFAPTLIGFGKILLPLIPEAVKQIKALI